MTEMKEVQEEIGRRVTRYVFGRGGDRLRTMEKVALLALAEVADDRGHIQVPAADLCRMTGTSQPTLRKSIGFLSERGLVENLGLIGPAMRRRIHTEVMRDAE